MPEPVLTTSFIVAGYATAAIIARPTSAVSVEADAVRNNAFTLYENAQRSVALYGRNSDCISDLIAIARESSEPNWDGYGAQPVKVEALKNAISLISSLSNQYPLPECSVEPDGDISLDWLPSNHQTLTISVGNTSRIPYAWIDGSDRGHAVSKLENGHFSSRILEEIKRFK